MTSRAQKKKLSRENQKREDLREGNGCRSHPRRPILVEAASALLWALLPTSAPFQIPGTPSHSSLSTNNDQEISSYLQSTTTYRWQWPVPSFSPIPSEDNNNNNKEILQFHPVNYLHEQQEVSPPRVHDPKRHLPWISCQAADHPRRDRLVGAGLRSIGIMDCALHRHRLGFSLISSSPLLVFPPQLRVPLPLISEVLLSFSRSFFRALVWLFFAN